eukprot:Pgem_evm1s19061
MLNVFDSKSSKKNKTKPLTNSDFDISFFAVRKLEAQSQQIEVKNNNFFSKILFNGHLMNKKCNSINNKNRKHREKSVLKRLKKLNNDSDDSLNDDSVPNTGKVNVKLISQEQYVNKCKQTSHKTYEIRAMECAKKIRIKKESWVQEERLKQAQFNIYLANLQREHKHRFPVRSASFC